MRKFRHRRKDKSSIWPTIIELAMVGTVFISLSMKGWIILDYQVLLIVVKNSYLYFLHYHARSALSDDIAPRDTVKQFYIINKQHIQKDLHLPNNQTSKVYVTRKDKALVICMELFDGKENFGYRCDNMQFVLYFCEIHRIFRDFLYCQTQLYNPTNLFVGSLNSLEQMTMHNFLRIQTFNSH